MSGGAPCGWGRRPRREPYHVAIETRHDLGNACFTRQIGIGGHVHRLAMSGHHDFGLQPVEKLHQFAAPRMAGHMHKAVAVTQDFDAVADQAVEHRADGLLVAWNLAG